MTVPFLDLKAQHAEVADEIAQSFARIMANTAFIMGPDCAEFEAEFARFCGVKHCVGVANGTDALEVMLLAAGVGPGHEVILPANTFIATAQAVHRAGARPVLVDVDATHALMDPAQTESRITSKTRALLPVHLYGQTAKMEQFQALAKKHGLLLFEDAAQAQGATRQGQGIGSFGVAAGTSFYPGKNLGCYGDGGAVLTNDPEVARKAGWIRNCGSDRKYNHPVMGFNSRLDTLQAAVLRAKLKRLNDWNEARRKAAARYQQLLAGLPQVKIPGTLEGNVHVWHLFIVRVANRDKVLARLGEQGIGAGIHYPTPVHLHESFKFLGHKRGDFPVSEQLAAEILSLPMFPHITAAQQEETVAALREALQ